MIIRISGRLVPMVGSELSLEVEVKQGLMYLGALRFQVQRWLHKVPHIVSSLNESR